MTVIDTAMRVLHVVFAGAWAGGTLVMAGLVLPAARDGRLGGAALDWLAGRFTYLTLASVGVLFVTGGHLAGTGYTVESLTGSGRGHLVLSMVGLWLVLAGLLHVGTRALRDGVDDDPARAAARGLRWYRPGGVVAVLLLVVAGLL